MTDPVPALFDPPPPPEGSTVSAMVTALEGWRSTGQALGTMVQRSLLDQAAAVDLARAARRPTAITGANRVMLELLQGYGLVNSGAPVPAEGTPLEAFLKRVQAHANGADSPS